MPVYVLQREEDRRDVSDYPFHDDGELLPLRPKLVHIAAAPVTSARSFEFLSIYFLAFPRHGTSFEHHFQRALTVMIAQVLLLLLLVKHQRC